MKKQATYSPKYTMQMLAVLVLLALGQGAKAQIFRTAFNSNLLKDSLIANSNKDFIYNNITVTNTSANRLSMTIAISAPANWQMVTENVVTLTLEPNASSVVPIRLLPANSVEASWEAVRINYRNTATNEVKDEAFFVRVQEFSKFKATLPHSNNVLTGYQKNLSLPVYIKNAGNTDGIYTITYKNEFLRLDGKTDIKLKGGSDTTYNINISLSESEWSMLKKEEVHITVSNNDDAFTLSQNLMKAGNELKEHSSAYATMPLQIEGGAAYAGDKNGVQYYGGIYGSVKIDDNNQVSIAARSKTYSSGQTLENSILRADYKGTHFSASAGNIQAMNEFMADGYGAKAAYKANDNVAADVYAVAKSRVGDTKIFGGSVRYKLLDNVSLNQSVAVNLDNIKKINSGIVKQVADIKISEHMKLSLVTGIGADVNNGYLAGNADKVLVGSSLGYNFAYTGKHINVFSSLLRNSNNYTGIYRGQRLQNHEVRAVKDNVFAGAYYESSLKKENYFADSLLLTNVFNLYTQNFGGRFGWSNNSSNIVISAGNQKQRQASDGPSYQTSYNYVNINSSAWLAKKVYVSVNSFVGYTSITEVPAVKTFVSTTQASIQYKGAGLTARYDKGPFYYSDMMTYMQKHESYERILLSPYAEVNLLKRSLVMRAQYNYAQVSPETPVASSMLLNVSYSNTEKGYDLQLNAMVPVQQQGADVRPYISASFRVRLNAPCVVARKYHTVKMVMFKDANSNGVKDAGEEAIAGQMISLNGNLFVSDEKGEVIYKNVAAGNFKADFGYSSKIKGWSPSAGSVQEFATTGDQVQYVPFRHSKILQGKLTAVEDPSSSLHFKPGNIKVTVTGSDNSSYSTLTDENGEFYFNLPTDNYIVSLSESAFDEHFHPSQLSQRVDLTTNDVKSTYFEIRQKKRQINIIKH